MDLEIATLGAAKLDPQTSVPFVHAQVDQGDGEPSDYGQAPFICALGLTALPAPATDTGHAEGVLAQGLGGSTGMCVGARDTRCADVAKGLGPGGTAVHSTGADASKRSQVRCLEDKLAFLVGNDTPIVVDRANKALTIGPLWGGGGAGYSIEVSDANGIVLCDKTGTGMISIKGGVVTISGTLTLAGGVSMGGAAAQPLVLNPALQTYLTALETYLAALATGAASAPAGSGVTAAATAFTGAIVAPKAAMGAVTTKGQ